MTAAELAIVGYKKMKYNDNGCYTVTLLHRDNTRGYWLLHYYIRCILKHIHTTLAWAFKGAAQCLTHIFPGQYHRNTVCSWALPVQSYDQCCQIVFSNYS